MFDGGGLHLLVKPNGSKLWSLLRLGGQAGGLSCAGTMFVGPLADYDVAEFDLKKVQMISTKFQRHLEEVGNECPLSVNKHFAVIEFVPLKAIISYEAERDASSII